MVLRIAHEVALYAADDWRMACAEAIVEKRPFAFIWSPERP
jgi:hypothetical protein